MNGAIASQVRRHINPGGDRNHTKRTVAYPNGLGAPTVDSLMTRPHRSRYSEGSVGFVVPRPATDKRLTPKTKTKIPALQSLPVKYLILLVSSIKGSPKIEQSIAQVHLPHHHPSGLPQFRQNFASGLFSCAQCGHFWFCLDTGCTAVLS